MSEGSRAARAPTDLAGRVSRFLLGPTSALPLEAFRWATTLSLLVYTLAWSLEAREWLSDAGYHVSPEITRGLQYSVPLLPGWAVPVFLVVYVGSMVAILLRVRPRLFSWVVLLGLAYVTFADRLAAFSMNKIALVAWLVICLSPWVSPWPSPEPGSGSSSGEPATEQPATLASAWPIRVLQATVILQYLGAGICKLRGDWLDSSRVLWLQAQDVYMTDLAAWLVRTLPMWVWAGMQHTSLAFELLAPILFCLRRARPVAFVWGAAMHLGIALLMYRVGYFSLSVVAYYVLFFDERWLEALRDRGVI